MSAFVKADARVDAGEFPIWESWLASHIGHSSLGSKYTDFSGLETRDLLISDRLSARAVTPVRSLPSAFQELRPFPGAEFGCGFSGSLRRGFGCAIQAKTCWSLSRMRLRMRGVACACALAWLRAAVADCWRDGDECAGVGAGAGGWCDSRTHFGGMWGVFAEVRGGRCTGACDVSGPGRGARCGGGQ